MNSFKQGGYSPVICKAIRENWDEWGYYTDSEIEQYCALYTPIFIMITNDGFSINEAIKNIKKDGYR